MKAYDRAIELIPANDISERTLASADKTEELAAAGRWEDALQSANKALELDPRNSVMWHFKAFILTNLGRKEEALQAFDESLKQNPKDITNWQYKAGLLTEMKRYNESLETYDKILELIPENDSEGLAQTWLAIGEALNRTGKQEEALGAFQKSLGLYDNATREKPGDVSLLQSKSRALFNLGRYDEALAILDQLSRTLQASSPI